MANKYNYKSLSRSVQTLKNPNNISKLFYTLFWVNFPARNRYRLFKLGSKSPANPSSGCLRKRSNPIIADIVILIQIETSISCYNQGFSRKSFPFLFEVTIKKNDSIGCWVMTTYLIKIYSNPKLSCDNLKTRNQLRNSCSWSISPNPHMQKR